MEKGENTHFTQKSYNIFHEGLIHHSIAYRLHHPTNQLVHDHASLPAF